MSFLAYALEPHLGRFARFALPIAWALAIATLGVSWLLFGWIFL